MVAIQHVTSPSVLPGFRSTLRQIKKGGRLRRFSPLLEAQFQQFHAEQTHVQARVGLALGFLAWCAFSLWDWLEYPTAFQPLAAVRFAIVTPIVLGFGCLIATHPGCFKSRMRQCLAVSQALASLGLLLMLWIAGKKDPGEAVQRYAPAFMGLGFFQYAFLGMQFHSAVRLGLFNMTAFGLYGLGAETGAADIGATLLHLVVLNILGMVVCARHEVHLRDLFRFRARQLRQFRTIRRERQKAQSMAREAVRQAADAEAARALALAESEKLAALGATRERFISAAYHDLQQPLSIIGLYVRLAKGKLDGTSKAGDACADLGVIENAAREIAAMFQGVRDTCEIGRSEPVIEPVELNEVFEEIRREFVEPAGLKGLGLRVRRRRKAPFFVLSDRTLLKRAIANLVSNAIKYTERGGVVVGSSGFGGRLRIDVTDTGIGIPEPFQARIFDEYYRVEGTGRDRRQGLGLGLSIVQRIGENLPDHRLTFHSKVGRGSRFSLEVPFAADPGGRRVKPVAALPSTAAKDVLRGKYVIVVEDDRRILAGMLEAVRIAGCLAEGVESAAACRALFAERDRCPDALVVDFRLGCGATGLDVVAALRQKFEWAGCVPVLFVSGELGLAEAVAPFDGRHEVYHKPVDPAVLVGRLARLISPP